MFIFLTIFPISSKAIYNKPVIIQAKAIRHITKVAYPLNKTSLPTQDITVNIKQYFMTK